MPSKPTKSNRNTLWLINELRKAGSLNRAPIWSRIAEIMEKPRRNWAEVNVGKLCEYARDGTTVFVPGRVLGDGELKAKLTVAAFGMTLPAKKKIINAGGTVVTIPELLEMNPKGTGIILMK